MTPTTRPSTTTAPTKTSTTVKATPAISTQATASPNNVVGTAVLSDSAVLSGGYIPGGTITFTLTAPSGAILPGGTVTVNGDGTYSSQPVTPTQVGTYTWHATYSGDTKNVSVSDNGFHESIATVAQTGSISGIKYPRHDRQRLLRG